MGASSPVSLNDVQKLLGKFKRSSGAIFGQERFRHQIQQTFPEMKVPGLEMRRKLRWDPSTKSPHIVLSNDGLTASIHAGGSWQIVFGYCAVSRFSVKCNNGLNFMMGFLKACRAQSVNPSSLSPEDGWFIKPFSAWSCPHPPFSAWPKADTQDVIELRFEQAASKISYKLNADKITFVIFEDVT